MQPPKWMARLPMAELSNVCIGWAETLQNAGYFPGIYGNYSLYDVLTTDILNTYDYWLAYVSTQTGTSTYNPSNTNVSSDCSMWQYSFEGYEYDGIGLDILDVNVSYKDYPAIMAQYGYNNVGPSYESVSTGSNYYPQLDAADGDAYADDLVKLTDGNKGSIYGGETERFSHWFAPSLDIILDVGTDASYNTFKVYAAAGLWGVEEPTGLTVSVADSIDGPYTEVDADVTITQTATGDGSSTWDTYLITATLNSSISTLSTRAVDAISNQYVKFTITPTDDGTGGGHLWLDEIEVGYTPSTTDVGGGSTTSTVINSIELTTTSSVVAGNTIFTPTVKSINGDTSLASAATSATLTQWWNEAGTSQYASGTVFEEGVVYDLYFKLTCNSGYSFSDSCVMTIETANGTFTGEYYSATSTTTARAYDFIITAAAAGSSTPDPDEPTDTVISSIEIVSTGTAAAGNALFTATLASINGNADIIGEATSGFSMQWYDEAGTTPLYASSTNFAEGTVYDLYIKVTRSDAYTFADTVVYTLTTPDGTYNGTIYTSETTDTVQAFDFYVTGLSASGSTDPVEKFVIESLEFEVNAFDPAVGNTVFSPTLVSVNGDAELLKYIEENHTKWYTITGTTVTEYNNTTFEALNIGFKYDLYFSITPTDEAEFTTSTTLKLTTSSRTHNGTLYVFDAETGTISFDIYFETETVSVPDQSVFITGFNTSIVAGAAQIFTPDFGTVSNSTANVTWTANAIAKYDEELDAYVVTELIFPTETGCTVDRTLADDEIFIAVHWDDSETDGVTEANRTALMAVQPGMLLEFNNIDLENKTIGSNPTIEFYTMSEPVVSLGAKANESLYGIRFGATYNKVFGYGEVTGLGFLLISEYRLGDNALDLTYTSNAEIAKYVVNVEARTIVEYVEGKDFSEYETFTFYASVVRLDRKNNLDDNIVAVPYITYASGKTVYGKQMMNNFNGVLAGNSSF